MPPVVLKDTKKNPTHAQVDDVILAKGGEAVELTDDQISRLKASKLTLDVSGTDSEPEPDSGTQNVGQQSFGGGS